MLELISLFIFEVIGLMALHNHIQTYFGTRKRNKLKARLRGCL